MDMPVNVPVDDPNADTEWNDILRKHGIIPEKPPSPTPLIEEAIIEARRLAHENRLEGKDLDELDSLEDEEDEEFLNKYRAQRLAELTIISRSSIYGQVYPLQKPDYARDVTETSNNSFVLVLLTSSLGTNVESRLLSEIWSRLALKYGDIKFCEMRGNLCIEGYPEKNTPTVLIYKDGEIKKQLVTLREMNGNKTTLEDFEKLLLQLEALKHNDPRLRGPRRDDSNQANSSIRQGSLKNDDSNDDDWD
ncbi:MAG: hypothetical protein M1834_003402 [Cirrosporium novae-zelandiae]|nr:MAG: hypothetical protein M1834_003402 [Cirrosporium novae-zelandiae]